MLRSLKRITPAYAGKSIVFLVCAWKIADHPRLCGEKGELCKANKITLGSPPPMRGKAFKNVLVIMA